MHTAATWLELAAHARAVADSTLDRVERRAMLDIVVADYERQAQEASLSARYFDIYSSPIW
jgi:hypothetical protein